MNRGPFAKLALGPDFSAMRFDDAPGNVKAEAQPPAIVFADLPEPLENTFQHRGGNTLSGIADREMALIAFATAANADLAAARGELI